MFDNKKDAQAKAKEIRGKMLELGPKNFAAMTKDLTVVKEGDELEEMKVRGKEVFDKTFANRTQADNFAKKNGGKVKQVGRVFYVFKEEVEMSNYNYRTEAHSPMHVSKAVRVAKQMGGNMTGAVEKIEKMKKGLSDHPKVKAALRLANEEVEMDENIKLRRESFESEGNDLIENARADARRAMKNDPDMKQRFSKNVSADDDDRKAADKNIIVQLRRITDLPRGGEVEFKNGKTMKVSQKDAKKLIKGFDGLRKGPDKERFQRMAGKDASGLKQVMRLVK